MQLDIWQQERAGHAAPRAKADHDPVAAPIETVIFGHGLGMLARNHKGP